MAETDIQPNELLAIAENLRGTLSSGFRDEIVKALYTEAEQIARRAVKAADDKKYVFDQRMDRIVTSPIFGLSRRAPPCPTWVGPGGPPRLWNWGGGVMYSSAGVPGPPARIPPPAAPPAPGTLIAPSRTPRRW